MDAERRAKLEETTRYDPGEVEGRVYATWWEGGWFTPEPEGTAEENYSIAIPPPNVTGSLHMGHGLNNTIQDTLVRRQRMAGRRVKWIIGTDHAGIATQSVVEKELRSQGIDRQELGRDGFVERVWEWREQSGGRIIEQLKRLGVSGDFANERFTLDEGYVAAVHKVFVALYEKGLIYRDNYMVNWDPGSSSAISDLEVENREVTDALFSIAYPVEDSDRILTVATVRPETMLADTAVAVNPADERYRDLVGRHCILPLVGRRLPIIADEHVDTEFGTGALKITPGHDPNDFEIGRKHGLEEISVIGEDGRLTDVAGPAYVGLTAAEAQERIVADLRETGALTDEEPYVHSVPFSHRSGQRIEPLISLQWFCRMDELARPAIEVVRDGRITFTPERWGRVYLDWMENIRPWCVSRQLWWGHQLPVWYCDHCGTTIVAEHEPADDACESCGEKLRRDEDVLDTWFSSALWPFATLGWPEDTPELRAFYPTDVLSTARDIIYLWVARMIMSGLEFLDDIPFKDVYIHSVIQAPDGRRMSKSLGTGIDPLELIDSHGADALRFGLLAMSSSQDVRFSEAKVQQGRDLANKLWNASRLILLNAGDAEPQPSTETVEDRWILSRLERTVDLVGERLDAFDFAHAALELYRFVYSDLCDWYLEIVKPRLYDGPAEGDRSAAGNLLHVLGRTLAMAHPLMPFVTEEIWSYMPDRESELIVAPCPIADPARFDAAAEAEVAAAIELTRSLRRWRELAGVSPGSSLRARTAGEVHPLVLRLARLEFAGGDGEAAIAAVGAIDILPSDDLDPEAVATRIEELRGRLRGEVKRAEGKLANEKFVANAPADVVDGERGKLERYRAELEELGLTDPEQFLAGLEPLGWRFGLERMRVLCAALDRPQDRYRTLHVVGTNGKSSVTTMTAALLQGAGLRAGACVSPHVWRWAERTRIDGAEVDPAAFAAAAAAVAAAIETVEPELEPGERITQFEAAIAVSFVAFAAAEVDVAVVEAGLGGRLDATNVIPSTATALTSVGLDHVEYLGATEREIAVEKLAVLRDGTVLVTGLLSAEIAALALATAAERHADLITAPPLPAAALPGFMAPYLERNAAVAVALAETVTGPLAPESIAAALGHAALPGRAELLDGNPPWIADAAHNEAGARALAEALPALAAGRPVYGCLSILADKDAAAIAAALAPALDHCICTAADPGPAMGRPGARALAAGELAGVVAATGVGAEAVPDPAAAVALTTRLARERGGVALFAGSHYLLRYVWNARHDPNCSR